MKVNYFKKIMCGVLVVVMLLALVACGTEDVKDDTNVSTDNVSEENLETESLNTVVAVINGKEVTRKDVGDTLLESEKEIISEYIYKSMISEFFKDTEVTDTEIELQLQLIKTQVGENNWAMYLMYYGGGSE